MVDEHTRVSLLHLVERSITAERLVTELELFIVAKALRRRWAVSIAGETQRALRCAARAWLPLAHIANRHLVGAAINIDKCQVTNALYAKAINMATAGRNTRRRRMALRHRSSPNGSGQIDP